MSTPTPEQIRTVQTNIERMIAFNEHVYNFGHTKIEVAFKLLSRTDAFGSGAISDEAAKYLFIDSVPGVTINPEGVYLREEVFTGIGIPVRTKHVVTGGGFALEAGAEETAPEQLSFAYLRAMKEGRTLTALIQNEGRDAVQSRVIAAAHADPIFAHDLSMRPRETLEEFLGVKIADVIDVVVTVEGSCTFGLVIPEPPAPNE